MKTARTHLIGGHHVEIRLVSDRGLINDGELCRINSNAKVIPDPRGPCINPVGAVVLVHGLFGDPVDLFTNQETHSAWPELIREDNYSLKQGGRLSDYDVVLLQNDAAVGSPLNFEELSLRAMRQMIDDKVFDTNETVILSATAWGAF